MRIPVRSRSQRRNRSGRRRARLRTWTRGLGTSGLSLEAEAWAGQIEDEMRRAVFGSYEQPGGRAGLAAARQA